MPGKAVYALFAFVSIDNFKSYLHNLQGDIMILINDVAAILHEEVYRWGYEDKGQCNKNLGSAFLMVSRKCYTWILNILLSCVYYILS